MLVVKLLDHRASIFDIIGKPDAQRDLSVQKEVLRYNWIDACGIGTTGPSNSCFPTAVLEGSLHVLVKSRRYTESF